MHCQPTAFEVGRLTHPPWYCQNMVPLITRYGNFGSGTCIWLRQNVPRSSWTAFLASWNTSSFGKDEARGTQYDIVSMEQNRSRVCKEETIHVKSSIMWMSEGSLINISYDMCIFRLYIDLNSYSLQSDWRRKLANSQLLTEDDRLQIQRWNDGNRGISSSNLVRLLISYYVFIQNFFAYHIFYCSSLVLMSSDSFCS